MAVSAVLTQLKYADQFLDAQASLLTGDMAEQSIESYCQALCQQLNNVGSIDIVAANSLNAAIAETKFKPELKQKLASVVASRHVQEAQLFMVGRGRVGNGTQELFNPLGYFQQSTWDYWKNPGYTSDQKMDLLASACDALNLLHPSEQTQRRLCGMVGACIWQHPNAKSLYGLVCELRVLLERYGDNHGVTYLLTYPNNPMDLPEDLKRRAYKGDFSRVYQHELPNYAGFKQLCVLRKHSKLLKDHVGSSCNHAPSGSMQPMVQPTEMQQQVMPALMGLPATANLLGATNEATLLGTILGQLTAAHQQAAPPLQDKAAAAPPEAATPKLPTFLPFKHGGLLSGSSSQAHTTGEASAVASAPASDAEAEENSDTEVQSMEEVDALEKMVLGSCKKKRRPAGVMKRPARVNNQVKLTKKGGKYPPPPPDKEGTTYMYNNGRVYVSLTMEAYRAIPPGTKSDYKFFWSGFPSRKDAWNAALKKIDTF